MPVRDVFQLMPVTRISIRENDFIVVSAGCVLSEEALAAIERLRAWIQARTNRDPEFVVLEGAQMTIVSVEK